MSVELLVQAQLAARCAKCGAGFSVDRAGRVWPDELTGPQRAAPPPLPPNARIRRLATVALKQVPSAAEAAPQIEERGATGGDDGRGGYLLTREGAHAQPKRRRVVVVTRTPRKKSVRARIVSLPANFGRDDRTPAPPMSVGELSKARAPEAAEPDRRGPLLAGLFALLVVAGLAFMISGGVDLLGQALTVAPPERRPPPPAPAAVVEADAALPPKPPPKPKPVPKPVVKTPRPVEPPAEIELLQVKVTSPRSAP